MSCNSSKSIYHTTSIALLVPLSSISSTPVLFIAVQSGILRPQHGVIGAHKGIHPLIPPSFSHLLPGRHASGQDRMAINKDCLVPLSGHAISLVEDANVTMSPIRRVPIPDVSVQRLMSKPVHTLDVTKVVRRDQRAVARAVVAAPLRARQQTQLLAPGHNVGVKPREALTHLDEVGCRAPERMVDLYAKVEYDERLRGCLGAESAVAPRNLRRHSSMDNISCKCVGIGLDNHLEERCDCRVEQEQYGWDGGVASGEERAGDELDEGPYEYDGVDFEKVFDCELLALLKIHGG